MTLSSTQLQDLADQVVALVGDTAEANVRVARTRHGLTRFANSFIHQHVGEDTVTVSLTAAVEGRTASASTTAVGPDALGDLVRTTVDSARLQPLDPHWPGATPPAEVAGDSFADPSTVDATPDQRAEQVRRFVAAAPDLRAAGYADTQTDWVAFASTAGQRAVGTTSRATLDGIHQTDRSAGTAHQTSRAIGDLDPAQVGELAADRARRSADFVDLDPGRYEVVLGPEAVSTLLTFLAYFGFNAKSHVEGASFAELGQQQFDPGITISDDPTDPRAIGVAFDAEGTPRSRQQLVHAGVTTSLAHDRRTARQVGTVSSGNAIPSGETIGPVPMNIVLAAGDRSPADLIADVERGLLVTTFHYVRPLDPKTVVATGLTRNGTFLIEDGRIAGAVGNLRFTQSFVSALGPGNVLGIGDDDRHAASEFGPGMVITPSLRLGDWNFTGGAKG